MSAPEALRRQGESRKKQEMPLHESPSTKMQMLQLPSRHLDELKPLKEASKSVDQVVERKRPRTRSSARLLKDDSTRVLKETQRMLKDPLEVLTDGPRVDRWTMLRFLSRPLKRTLELTRAWRSCRLLKASGRRPRDGVDI